MQSLMERNAVMKKLSLLLLFSLAASVRGDNPPSPAHSQINKPAPAPETVQAHAAPQQDQKSTTQIEVHARETPLHVGKPAPNETAHGHVKVDGILVQLVKTDNPLQLINPAAPERYGSAEDNVVRDPASGKVSGLKFLELRFC
jgi:hypothetical protein